MRGSRSYFYSIPLYDYVGEESRGGDSTSIPNTCWFFSAYPSGSTSNLLPNLIVVLPRQALADALSPIFMSSAELRGHH